eukprot:c21192_g1_i1 orf=141-689(+)
MMRATPRWRSPTASPNPFITCTYVSPIFWRGALMIVLNLTTFICHLPSVFLLSLALTEPVFMFVFLSHVFEAVDGLRDGDGSGSSGIVDNPSLKMSSIALMDTVLIHLVLRQVGRKREYVFLVIEVENCIQSTFTLSQKSNPKCARFRLLSSARKFGEDRILTESSLSSTGSLHSPLESTNQ